MVHRSMADLDVPVDYPSRRYSGESIIDGIVVKVDCWSTTFPRLGSDVYDAMQAARAPHCQCLFLAHELHTPYQRPSPHVGTCHSHQSTSLRRSTATSFDQISQPFLFAIVASCSPQQQGWRPVSTAPPAFHGLSCIFLHQALALFFFHAAYLDACCMGTTI